MLAGRHWENDWLIGPGMALDPAKYFILVINMFGNGLSSSPSNTPPPFDRARFPQVTYLAPCIPQRLPADITQSHMGSLWRQADSFVDICMAVLL